MMDKSKDAGSDCRFNNNSLAGFLGEGAERARAKPFGRGWSTVGKATEFYFVSYGK
jgi:hypothetical protein